MRKHVSKGRRYFLKQTYHYSFHSPRSDPASTTWAPVADGCMDPNSTMRRSTSEEKKALTSVSHRVAVMGNLVSIPLGFLRITQTSLKSM